MKKTTNLLLCVILILGMTFSTMPVASAATTGAKPFVYYLNNNGKEYSVCIGDSSEDVEFPSTYNGLPVTTIKSGSKGASKIKTIYIPDSITTINDYAFENFKALEKVSGAKGLKKIGFAAFRGCKKLTTVELGSKIASIGRYAFESTSINGESGYPNLFIIGNYLIKGSAAENEGTIIIPEGIITIADYALENAFQRSDMVQGSKTVILPKSLRCIGDFAFFETRGMTDIQLPAKLLSIGKSAFSFNSGLKNVNIPASVKSIGIGAFSDCGNINVTIDSDSKYFKIVDKVLFRKDGKVIYDHYGKIGYSYKVPEGVEKIAANAFYQSDLTGVTISSTVKTIGEGAFKESKNLKAVVLGKSVSNVGQSAFQDCTKLSTLTVQKGCATIGNRMFSGCTALKSVALPAGVKTIEHFAFYGCTNLSKLSLPSTITNIGSNAFSDTYYVKNAKYTNGILYCGTNIIATKAAALGSTVTIKNGTTCIAGYTFGGLTVSGTTISKNTKVKDFVFPESLRYIGMYAFSEFDSLASLTIPAGVKSIGEGSFRDCKSLKKIIIKGGTTSIGKAAFTYSNSSMPDDITIYALKGSKAHTYAAKNDFKFKSTGIYLATPVLTATKNVSNGLNIKWNAVKCAAGYRVYRKAPGETSWTRLGDVKGLSFTDKKVTNGKKYTYTVKAFNGKTFSSHNKTGISQKFIATPKLTKISNGSKGIQINWSKVSGVDGYIVYKKTSEGWAKIAVISGVNTVSYVDENVTAGSTYTYTVKAYAGSLFSGFNTTGISIKRLLAPQLLSATSGKTGVTLKWGKVTGAGGYCVYRKTGSGAWEELATVTGGTKVTYLDKTAKKGVTYSYTVKAISGKYKSSHNSKGLTVKDKY